MQMESGCTGGGWRWKICDGPSGEMPTGAVQRLKEKGRIGIDAPFQQVIATFEL